MWAIVGIILITIFCGYTVQFKSEFEEVQLGKLVPWVVVYAAVCIIFTMTRYL